MKNKTWEKIGETFNANSGQTYRSSDILRQKYESVKKNLKKKINKNKQETMKTGGGIPDYIMIDGPEKELLEVLSLLINGLPSISDSDGVLPETTNTGEIFQTLPISRTEVDNYFEEDSAVPVIVIKNIKMLPTKSETQNQTTDNSKAHDSDSSVKEIARSEDFPAPSSTTNIESESKEITGPVEKASQETSSNNSSWKNWSPVSLKSKKHPVLTPRKSSVGRDIHMKKINTILELREQLLRDQIQNTIREEIRAQERHKLEIKILQKKLNEIE